ncbi:MAG TPA: helix-turn-helix domain-containing protein [Rubrivivax sp.]|nr:helix-turn-helix domain-containing protein [Rubrivivax sp.]
MPEPAGRDADSGAAPQAPRSAGAMLRAAREREGLHLAVLAATIKVSPAKLQALEQDRYDELPNATFARALAQSVCRCLKIDPRPVLALLPQPDAPPLEAAVGRINAPFHERGGRAEGQGLARVSKPMFWAGGLLLLAAIVIALLPGSVLEGLSLRPTPPASGPASDAATDATDAAGATAADGTLQAQPHSPPEIEAQDRPQNRPQAAAPAVATAASALPPAEAASPAPGMPGLDAATAAAPPASVAQPLAATPPAAEGLLSLRASADSWIEVVDAQERILFSRVLRAGETALLDGRPPLHLRIGNAAATTVLLRGEPVDLAPHTRVNVARLELR